MEDECRYREYSEGSAQDAATVVSERCMIAIREALGQDFKLIIQTSVLARGTALSTVSSCYW